MLSLVRWHIGRRFRMLARLVQPAHQPNRNLLTNLKRDVFMNKLVAALLIFALPAVSLSAYSVAQTTPEPTPLKENHICSELKYFAGQTYFCYLDPTRGRELVVNNTVSRTTRLVKDIDLGPGSSSPFGFFELGDELYFFAKTVADGWGLWKVDAQGIKVELVAPIDSSNAIRGVEWPNGNYRDRIYEHPILEIVGEIGGTTFFQIAIPSGGRIAPWATLLYRTDGTAAGTLKVSTLIPYVGTKIFNNHLYYFPLHGSPAFRRISRCGSFYLH